MATTDEDRVARQAHLQAAEADFDPLPFDAAAARAFGGVATSLRRSGRKATARTYDAMIAATAVAAELPVYTCNPSDFIGIDRLEVVEVPHPDSRLTARDCGERYRVLDTCISPEAESPVGRVGPRLRAGCQRFARVAQS